MPHDEIEEALKVIDHPLAVPPSSLVDIVVAKEPKEPGCFSQIVVHS